MVQFQYRLSHDVDDVVSVQLGGLVGCLPHHRAVFPQAGDEVPVNVDVVLDVVLAMDGHVVDNPVQSVYAPSSPAGAAWDPKAETSLLHLMVKVKELLPAVVLGVSVWAQAETGPLQLVGGAVMPMFSKKGRLKTGLQKLRLCPGCAPDLRWPSATAGKVPVVQRGERGRLRQKVKQFERSELPRCPWLDKKTFKAVHDFEASLAQEPGATDLHVVLYLPSFPFAVLYSQPSTHVPRALELPAREPGRGEHLQPFTTIHDPEVARAAVGQETNPCEYKALKLSQAMGGLGVDRDAKPNKEELASIRQVVAMPPSRPLTVLQKTLLSKFRYYLAGQSSTIVPFLKSVDWAIAQEADLAVEVMKEWQHVTVDEALQMLSGHFSHIAVRTLAVQVLQEKADDDKLYELMIQLIQCVRYDGSTDESPLADLLIDRCHCNTKLAIALHWSLIIDCEDPRTRDRIGMMQARLYSALQHANPTAHDAVNKQVRFKAFLDQFSKEVGSFRGNMEAKEEFLRSEMHDHGKFSELLHMNVPFSENPDIILTSVQPDQCKLYKSARNPVRFVFNTAWATAVAGAGQVPPSLPPPRPVQIMFKSGDDLRQDQFVCQLIAIMDNLLKRENLDLRLTPYWVLPMAPQSGVIEFVPSTTLQELTKRGKGGEDILRFLADHSPREDRQASSLRGAIAPQVMDNFIRSNAGYAIISYLLDMGDRHLENLLLTDSGKLFHIDFGYVLGMRDPKAWAKVPVAVKRDIIAAMGGQSSDDYKNFRKLAVEAYIILRKHAGLFLTLLGCMAGSPIECFAGDSSAVSLDFAMSQLEERLAIDVSDDVARTHIFTLIDQSIANTLAQVGDAAHRLVSNFR